jgi:flagellar motor switch protein FliN/FliY
MSSSPTSSSSTDAAAAVLAPEALFPGLLDLALPVAVRLGSGTISIRECLALRPASVVRLAQGVGQDVDLVVNGEVVARGEVAVVEDHASIRVTDIAVSLTDEAA